MGIGKASTTGIEISPTLPWFSQAVKKCEIWRRLKQQSILSSRRLKMQTHPWEPLDQMPHPIKLQGENVLKRE